MNIPNDVALAIKEKNTNKIDKKMPINDISIFDKIIKSYNDINNKIEEYKSRIKVLRSEANTIKEDIYLKKNINNINSNDEDNENNDIPKINHNIEINNFSINEETCATAINHINNIKSNISENSKLASNSLKPLEESFELLKTQVKYTIVLENILELFNKKNELEEKMKKINERTNKLADSLGIS